MKLSILLLVPLLTGCLATQAAVRSAQAATARLNALVSDQDATLFDLAEASAAQGGALAGIPEAIMTDGASFVESVKNGASWKELLLSAGASVLTAGYGVHKYRDMRKARGGDPLQRKDMATPPTTAGPTA